MFDIVVNTVEEFKELEMYLFLLILPFECKGNISILNTEEIYYYKTIKVDKGYVLVTC